MGLGADCAIEAGIAELNVEGRRRAGPAEVLSLAARGDAPDWLEGEAVGLGDLCVAVDTAQRQAQNHNHSLGYELHWLISHSLLHLLGWDHPDERRLSGMLALQERLLDSTGNVLPKGQRPVEIE